MTLVHQALVFGGGVVTGSALLTSVTKWRRASERRIWTRNQEANPRWTHVEFVVTHPVRAWRAKNDR